MIAVKRASIAPPAILLGTFAGYGLLLWLGIRYLRDGSLFVLLAPNLLFIGVSAWWIAASGIGFQIRRGARRSGLGLGSVLFCAVLMFAMTLFWPDRRGPGVTPYTLGLLLLVPVAEELFFRGVLLDFFRRKLSNGVLAAMAVSAIFGLAHLPQGLTVAVTLGVLGLVLALVTLATGSLIWPAALHLAWNGLAVLRELPQGEARWIVTGIAVAVMTMLSVLGMLKARPGPVPLQTDANGDDIE